MGQLKQEEWVRVMGDGGRASAASLGSVAHVSVGI